MRTHSRANRRWLVPAAALASVLALGAAPSVLGSASAQTPDLPPLSPAELLVKAHGARVTTLSGTLRLDSRLGLPSFAGLGATSSPLTSLVAGTHTARIWLDGPGHLRLALPSPMAENDWIRNGSDLWSWDSTTQRATHATLPAEPPTPDPPKPDPAPHDPATPDPTTQDPTPPDPARLAQQLLDMVTPTTEVTVRSPRYVAGRPAYELSLVPHSAATTVGEVAISVDAATGLPLDVRVTPRGASDPAFEFGFTDLDLARPDAAEFAFTPPPGATVVQAKGPGELLTRPSREGDGHDGRDERDGHDGPRTPAAAGTAPAAGAGDVASRSGDTKDAGPRHSVVGTSWDSVVVLNPGGPPPASLDALLGAAKRVTTANGSGRLLTTTLVNVLIMDDGRVAAGAVRPASLEAAVDSA